MNPLVEYEGGGTYFSDTSETYKTDVGGVISFRGDLVHAGKAISKGVRYIIVCFIITSRIEQQDSNYNDNIPLHSIVSPVMYPLRSLARKAITFATSSGWPKCWSAIFF